MSLRSILRSTVGNKFQAATTVAVAETTAALTAARQERDAKVEAYRATRLSAPLEGLAETLAPFQAQVDAAERLVSILEERLATETGVEAQRLAAAEAKLDADWIKEIVRTAGVIVSDTAQETELVKQLIAVSNHKHAAARRLDGMLTPDVRRTMFGNWSTLSRYLDAQLQIEAVRLGTAPGGLIARIDPDTPNWALAPPRPSMGWSFGGIVPTQGSPHSLPPMEDRLRAYFAGVPKLIARFGGRRPKHPDPNIAERNRERKAAEIGTWDKMTPEERQAHLLMADQDVGVSPVSTGDAEANERAREAARRAAVSRTPEERDALMREMAGVPPLEPVEADNLPHDDAVSEAERTAFIEQLAAEARGVVEPAAEPATAHEPQARVLNGRFASNKLPSDAPPLNDDVSLTPVERVAAVAKEV
jgi:predicted Fe-S protein YdhL (DUF1289 family)